MIFSYINEIPGEDPVEFCQKRLEYPHTAWFSNDGKELAFPSDLCWRLDYGFFRMNGQLFEMGYAYWYSAGLYHLEYVCEERIV